MHQELSNTVFQKLQKLVKAFEQEKAEKEKLQLKIAECQLTAQQQQLRMEELEGQVAVLKSSQRQMDTAEKKELERRINQYVKDIDNAIMLLNE